MHNDGHTNTRLHMLADIALVDDEGMRRRLELLILVIGRRRRPVMLHRPTPSLVRHLAQVYLTCFAYYRRLFLFTLKGLRAEGMTRNPETSACPFSPFLSIPNSNPTLTSQRDVTFQTALEQSAANSSYS